MNIQPWAHGLMLTGSYPCFLPGFIICAITQGFCSHFDLPDAAYYISSMSFRTSKSFPCQVYVSINEIYFPYFTDSSSPNPPCKIRGCAEKVCVFLLGTWTCIWVWYIICVHTAWWQTTVCKMLYLIVSGVVFPCGLHWFHSVLVMVSPLCVLWAVNKQNQSHLPQL